MPQHGQLPTFWKGPCCYWHTTQPNCLACRCNWLADATPSSVLYFVFQRSSTHLQRRSPHHCWRQTGSVWVLPQRQLQN